MEKGIYPCRLLLLCSPVCLTHGGQLPLPAASAVHYKKKITFCCTLATLQAGMLALPSPAPASPAAIGANNANKLLMQSLCCGLSSERKAEALVAPTSATALEDTAASGEFLSASSGLLSVCPSWHPCHPLQHTASLQLHHCL